MTLTGQAECETVATAHELQDARARQEGHTSMATAAEQISEMTDQLMAPRSAEDRKRARLENRAYSQGMTREQRDLQDGARDAERVIAGLEPLRPLQSDVTAAYRDGWMATVELLLEAFPGSEVVAST